MPKIEWTSLPAALREHLFERLRERKISAEDLYQLKLWRESEPDAPDGFWYKDFGSFKICGAGKYPKTFLLRGQAAKGKELWKHSNLVGATSPSGSSAPALFGAVIFRARSLPKHVWIPSQSARCRSRPPAGTRW